MVTFDAMWQMCGFGSRVLFMRVRRLPRSLALMAVAVLMAAVLGLLHTQAVYASSSVVNTLTEGVTGSLRDAINKANDGGGTITFNINGTFMLTGTLPAINNTVSIDGSGHAITVSGKNLYQVLYVNIGKSLQVNSITIANGNSTSGAAILNAGILTVTNSTFVSNTATSLYGGAIYNFGTLTVINSKFTGNSANLGGGIGNFGTLYVTGSTLSGNVASGSGGGIYNNNGSALTVINSTISSNTANASTGSTAGGGGIYNDSNNTVSVISSTLSGNTTISTTSSGGGIYNGSNSVLRVISSTLSGNTTKVEGGGIRNSGTLVVINSTFVSNTAAVGTTGTGAGIHNAIGAVLAITGSTFLSNTAGIGVNYGIGGGLYNYGAVTVINSTFAGNSAAVGGGLSNRSTLDMQNVTISGNTSRLLGNGDGIYNFSNGTLTLTNSIIANGTTGVECVMSSGTVSSNHSLIEGTGTNGCGIVNGANGNIVGVDPLLGALANNGGATLTMAPLPGSLAIDAGDDASCPANDQRGAARPLGVRCDIGAVERLYTIVNSLTNTNDGVCNTAHCTLWEAIYAANVSPDADTITFTLSGTIVLTGTLPDINSPMTIDGSGHAITVSGANLYRVLVVNAGQSLEVRSLTIANGYAVHGSGINNLGTLTVTGSTLISNTATGWGGGIENQPGGMLTVINSTIVGNTSSQDGAAIDNYAATAVIINSTLSGNILIGSGAGLDTFAGVVVLTNTIIANTINGWDCRKNPGDGTIPGGYNLIESGGGGCDQVNGSNGNVIGFDPNLGTPANNGGATLTMAPLPGSPAANAGDNLSCPINDQREVPRPQPLGGVCDIGAVEITYPITFIVTTISEGDNGACTPALCTLRDAVNAANRYGPADVLFGANVNGTIVLTGSLPAISNTVSIDASGHAIIVSGANQYRVLEVNAGSALELRSLTIANGYADYGGGIINHGTLTVTGSTLISNTATIWGGGIENQPGGMAILINTTLVSNTTANYGSAIDNYAATLILINSTVSGNSIDGVGESITSDSTLIMVNTIIANTVNGYDCSNQVTTTGSNNLIESSFPGACGLVNNVNGNIIGSDPLLGALANNGGGTRTLSPLSGSPAINNGTNTSCPAFDQRGMPRPKFVTCDIGAVEYVAFVYLPMIRK